MPYIGPNPAESFTSFATQEFSTSATTSYTLDHAVANENEIALFVNNVRQQPGSGKAYTATGTALTLSAATASTDTMYCVFLGRALQTVTPATNSITAAMVGNDLISGKTALTSAPDDTDELLISDAGTLKRIDYSLIKAVNTPSFHVTQSSSQSFSNATTTKITYDTELYDVGSGFNTSNNNFTVPSGEDGKYFFYAQTQGIFADANGEFAKMNIYVDDTETKNTRHAPTGVTTDSAFFTTTVLNLSAGDVVDARLYNGQGTSRSNDNNAKVTYFLGYKLIG